MKHILGFVLVVLGIALGLYVGGYLMFYGGIIQVIGGIKAGWIAGTIAIGIIRIGLCSAVGWFAFSVLFIPGSLLLESN